RGEVLPRRRSTPAASAARCVASAVLCVAIALFGSVSTALGHVDPWPASAHRAIQVGSLELRPCLDAPAYCGNLDRPLDPTGAVPGRISIRFEYYPHS